MSFDNHKSQNKNSQIKWNKLLNEDLEELLKEKASLPLDNHANNSGNAKKNPNQS